MRSKKIYILTLITALISLSSFVSEPEIKGISWNRTDVDFDTIRQGEIMHTSFTCYNNSDSVLIFENVQGSCGCIVTDWQKEPIAPGDSSTIKVSFNSAGKSRQHVKVIAVYSNMGLFELSIKAVIMK